MKFKSSKRKPGRPAAGRAAQAPPPATDHFNDRKVLDELRKEAPEESAETERIILEREELEVLLAAGFHGVSNFVLDKMKRENVTVPEADRWSKATYTVYHKWLENMPAAMVTHALVTASILLNKKQIRGGELVPFPKRDPDDVRRPAAAPPAPAPAPAAAKPEPKKPETPRYQQHEPRWAEEA